MNNSSNISLRIYFCVVLISSNEETLANLLSDPAESVGESERLSFICSCAVQSVESGGSVLIPINRLGVTLQLLEQISASLDYSNLKVSKLFLKKLSSPTYLVILLETHQ